MSTEINISVIICTYNPIKDYLIKVIQALSNQSLPLKEWEIVIIDNNSDEPINKWIDVKWHTNAIIAMEAQPGLAHARLKGVSLAKGELIVFVDDDNVLQNGYLEKVLDFSRKNQPVGCFGGRSFPIFESLPPNWFFETGINLGCQDLGSEQYISNYSKVDFIVEEYPPFAPIGTGMVIKKQAFLKYLAEVKNSSSRLALGRKGKLLTSGEDNDIILTVVKHGYELAYLPKLVVEHLIPKNRYSFEYVKKMAYESNRSWVKVLQIHGINPWKPISSLSLNFRKIKAYFIGKAWLSKTNYIKWQGACGKFKGLSEL